MIPIFVILSLSSPAVLTYMVFSAQVIRIGNEDSRLEKHTELGKESSKFDTPLHGAAPTCMRFTSHLKPHLIPRQRPTFCSFQTTVDEPRVGQLICKHVLLFISQTKSGLNRCNRHLTLHCESVDKVVCACRVNVEQSWRDARQGLGQGAGNPWGLHSPSSGKKVCPKDRQFPLTLSTS